MSWHVVSFPGILAAVLFAIAMVEPAGAQVATRPGPIAPPVTSPGTTAKHPRQEPCWEVAGVSKGALQQRRAAVQQARQEVESVCANSSLSAQQKRVEIQQIHEREKQQIAGIITPAQQEAIRSCQQGRGGGHGGGGHMGGGGPCGEMAGGHKSHSPSGNFSEDDEEAPDQSAPKTN